MAMLVQRPLQWRPDGRFEVELADGETLVTVVSPPQQQVIHYGGGGNPGYGVSYDTGVGGGGYYWPPAYAWIRLAGDDAAV